MAWSDVSKFRILGNLESNLIALKGPATVGLFERLEDRHKEVVMLDLDVVTALGIIVAELVTNSYDHAFPDGAGAIDVSVQRDPDNGGRATLVIKDDGPGFEVNPGSKRHGLGLVSRLAQQVRGTASVAANKGTIWTISFPLGDPMGKEAEVSSKH